MSHELAASITAPVAISLVILRAFMAGMVKISIIHTLSLAHLYIIMNHHITAMITAAATIRQVTMRAFHPGVYNFSYSDDYLADVSLLHD